MPLRSHSTQMLPDQKPRPSASELRGDEVVATHRIGIRRLLTDKALIPVSAQFASCSRLQIEHHAQTPTGARPESLALIQTALRVGLAPSTATRPRD